MTADTADETTEEELTAVAWTRLEWEPSELSGECAFLRRNELEEEAGGWAMISVEAVKSEVGWTAGTSSLECVESTACDTWVSLLIIKVAVEVLCVVFSEAVVATDGVPRVGVNSWVRSGSHCSKGAAVSGPIVEAGERSPPTTFRESVARRSSSSSDLPVLTWSDFGCSRTGT